MSTESLFVQLQCLLTPTRAAPAAEVWPGSHRGTLQPAESLQSEGEHKEMVEERRDTPGQGPVQMEIPKGGVCLRDLRVWCAEQHFAGAPFAAV